MENWCNPQQDLDHASFLNDPKIFSNLVPNVASLVFS